MRIGINAYYLNAQFAGIGQYTINLLRALSRIDTTNKYYVFTNSKVEWDFPVNFKLVVIKPIALFPQTFLNRFIWEEYQLGWAIKKYKIEVFHAMYQSLPRGSERIANVVTVHDAIPWKFPSERKKISYRIYCDYRKDLVAKRAKKVITISETSKLDFAPIYEFKPETIEVTYESVDPVFQEQPNESELAEMKNKFNIKRDFILYTGGLKRHKNLRMLIKSFAILIEEYGLDVDLLILGAIRNNMAISQYIYYKVESLEKYAKLKKVGQRVKCIGFVSRKEMSGLMHMAKCFISLSLYEGFGLPALEAMTSGTPSVLSNLGAYPEIAADGALFVYPYGPHRVAQGLYQAIEDEDLRKELISQGLQRAKFFNAESIAQDVLDIYKDAYDDYRINFQP